MLCKSIVMILLDARMVVLYARAIRFRCKNRCTNCSMQGMVMLDARITCAGCKDHVLFGLPRIRTSADPSLCASKLSEGCACKHALLTQANNVRQMHAKIGRMGIAKYNGVPWSRMHELLQINSP